MSADMPAVRRHEVCRRLIAERRLVGIQLGFDLCPAPTWDMLLDLYLAHQEGRKIYLWSLCMASHVPTTSAHRKITELTRKGLLVRHADGADGRRVSIELTEQCLSRLDGLLDSISTQLGLQP
ncbi:hypothetical protein GCM10009087_19210 [Sphingomonas oligophenolica]|uniref:Helix-turn-helix domain-containing protein n=1 Tax=Sphingomonas oligophenolica TaxID=301154 RepID=A0ABU9Y344_9SPHN